ncbi:DUF4168 domain-containing protein [Halopseudomonas salina]|uniref:DUF4168 domain-containing protein n=1 Tax=Halopseudomonas salina TaxID=1323744 RepID=A0ABQ1PKD4_9GAMM|nr:DUF4168 domain-containing protein [Halopseudomonas salina]GGC98748.1 hypothetical protein GCM10007418_17570 [Halopseudomonas salina]
MNNLKTLAAAICLTAFGAAAPSVMAQATGAQQGQPAQQNQTQQGMASQPGMAGQQAATEISDADLEKFVEASDKVFEIRDEFTEKLNGVDDPQQAQSLQMEAQEEMMEAVTDTGIEVPVYNEIATRLQTDTDLQERAQQFN